MSIPLLDGFEKLINEHGSAVILKERLELARDKYAALEQKVATLQEDNSKLAIETQRLELDNYKLKEKVWDLEKQLFGGHDLEPDEINIVRLLGKYPDGISSVQICQALNLQQPRVEHFLSTLTKKKMITALLSMLDGARYLLDNKGNEYLVRNGYV